MKIRKESLLYPGYPDYDYIDSYEYVIMDPENKTGIPEIAEAFIRPGPKWVEGLFALRNWIASAFHLKTPATLRAEDRGSSRRWEAGAQAGIFKVFDKTQAEIILGEDDSHLDFRISLLLERNGHREGEKKVTVTTAVKINNRLGKCYFFVVKPFHRMIVPFVLKRNFKRLSADA